jgi:hypothetical protein
MEERAFPRSLRAKEEDLLLSVLPIERPGYATLRAHLRDLVVLAEGKRGSGHLILGPAGTVPDVGAPLPPVIAFGAVEATTGTFFITVRESSGTQLDVELVSQRGEEVPDHFEEKRRWTYSTWAPGMASPATGARVREVDIEQGVVLAICPAEKRLWVWEKSGGVVLLIPVTNFYNELMLQNRVRDPEVALRSQLLFERADSWPAAELRSAFRAYNATRKRVELLEPSREQPPGWRARVRAILSGR